MHQRNTFRVTWRTWCTRLSSPSRFEEPIVLVKDLLDCQQFLWFRLEYRVNGRFKKITTSVNLLRTLEFRDGINSDSQQKKAIPENVWSVKVSSLNDKCAYMSREIRRPNTRLYNNGQRRENVMSRSPGPNTLSSRGLRQRPLKTQEITGCV